ncbi:hypothetical protein [Paenibacillus thermotolerans]|uniref:hypothetical protein n=1 Tax=Paenibacillus thermotolerans TaxID=3027807 RepID=UPI0023687759|nr:MULTISPECIES: hypothetical protein [unclassified Paenibacillus]
MKFDDINDVFMPISGTVRKGTVILIEVTTNGIIEEYDKGGISTKAILNSWTYGANRLIKPFKLQSYSYEGSTFKASLEVVKKSKELDELKLLCQDIIDVYNYENINIIKWTNRLEE